jgi:hypothetical protein
MGRRRSGILLAVAGLVLWGCTSEAEDDSDASAQAGSLSAEQYEWGEQACAEFSPTHSGAGEVIPRLSSTTTIGEMRQMLAGGGVATPPEWENLQDDDPVASCTYEVESEGESTPATTLCSNGESFSLGTSKQVTYLVDEGGGGIVTSTSETAAPPPPSDCTG